MLAWEIQAQEHLRDQGGVEGMRAGSQSSLHQTLYERGFHTLRNWSQMLLCQGQRRTQQPHSSAKKEQIFICSKNCVLKEMGRSCQDNYIAFIWWRISLDILEFNRQVTKHLGDGRPPLAAQASLSCFQHYQQLQMDLETPPAMNYPSNPRSSPNIPPPPL